MARRKTILVVEDEPHARFLAVKSLELLGHLVMSVENAEEAKEVWELIGNGVDLLVTDVVMPGMDGIELARGLRESHPVLRIIFLTGSSDRDADIAALGGAIKTVYKAYSVLTLRTAIDEVFKDEQ